MRNGSEFGEKLRGLDLGAKVFAEGFRRLQGLQDTSLGSMSPTRVLADRRVVVLVTTALFLTLAASVAFGWDSRSSNSPNINTVSETATPVASDFSPPISHYLLPRFADVVSRDIQTVPTEEGINLQPVSNFTPVRFRIDVKEGVNVRYAPDQKSGKKVETNRETDQTGYVYKVLPNGANVGVYSEFVVRTDTKSGEITIFAARAGEKGLEYFAIYANGRSLVRATIEGVDSGQEEITVRVEDMFREHLPAQTPREAPVIK